MEKNINRVFKNLSSLVIANGSVYLLTGVLIILIGREHGPTPLGVFSLAFVILTIFRTIIESGYDFSLQRDIAKGTHNNILNTQQIKNTLWLLLFIPSILVLYITINDYSVFILIFYNLLFAQNSTFKSILKGHKKMELIAKLDLLYTFLLVVSSIIVLYTFFNLIYIFIFYLLTELSKSFHFYSVLKNKKYIKNYKYFEFFKISKINNNFSELKNQLPLVLYNFISSLHYRVPVLILGWFSTQQIVGYYTGALRFITIFKILPGSMLQTLLPEFSESNDLNKLIKAISLGAFLSLIIFIPVYFLSEEIIILLLTDKFSDSVNILKILSLLFIPTTINVILESYLIAGNYENQVNIGLIISAIFVFIFSYLSINYYDVNFVALSAVFGEIICMIIFSINILNLNRNKIGRRT